MYATIVKETDAVEFNVDEWHIGDRIEVLGFVRGAGGSGVLMAVWRDDEGEIYELPIWAIRMVPNHEAKQQSDLKGRPRTVAHVRPQMTNAIAGPQTGRGVRV